MVLPEGAGLGDALGFAFERIGVGVVLGVPIPTDAVEDENVIRHQLWERQVGNNWCGLYAVNNLRSIGSDRLTKEQMQAVHVAVQEGVQEIQGAAELFAAMGGNGADGAQLMDSDGNMHITVVQHALEALVVGDGNEAGGDDNTEHIRYIGELSPQNYDASLSAAERCELLVQRGNSNQDTRAVLVHSAACAPAHPFERSIATLMSSDSAWGRTDIDQP